MAVMRQVTWLGGIQDGAVVSVPHDTTWVNVLEDRRSAVPIKPDPDKPTPRALVRYTVPIIDNKIIWAQRVQADLEDE